MKIKSYGFTIVELLVVIVVIGILAAITIVSFTGISQKAVASSIQSDLNNASKALKLFQVDNMAYPTSISTNCSTTPTTTSNLCLKLSSGNSYIGYSATNSTSSQSFLLIAGNGNTNYRITNATSPTQLATTMQLNVTPGAILELRAAKANGGISQGINSPLTTTWYDTSGNGNNGTLTGFTGQTPWSGTGTTGDPYALDHTSTSGPRGVLVPASTSLNLIGSSSFTSEIIVKLPPIGINPQWFMGRGAAYGALGFGFVAWDAVSPTPYMQFYYGDGAHGLAATNFGYLPRGTRLHLAVVINRSNATVRSFLDGEFVDQQSIAGFGSFLDVADSLDLLNTNYGAFGGTPKSVYLARLYPFALTSDQIGENYDAGVN